MSTKDPVFPLTTHAQVHDLVDRMEAQPLSLWDFGPSLDPPSPPLLTPTPDMPGESDDAVLATMPFEPVHDPNEFTQYASVGGTPIAHEAATAPSPTTVLAGLEDPPTLPHTPPPSSPIHTPTTQSADPSPPLSTVLGDPPIVTDEPLAIEEGARPLSAVISSPLSLSSSARAAFSEHSSPSVDGCWDAVMTLFDGLQQLKHDRDSWDRQVPSWKARVAAHLTTSEGVCRELDQGFERLWHAYCRLAPDHQRPIAQALHAMAKETGLIDAEINRHIMTQPFGYAGDFQAIDYLYDYADAWLGQSSYDLLLNDYTTSIPIAYSTCLRKTTMSSIIREHLAHTEHPHVVSVGSGRAREWEELLREGHITRPLMVTFVDMDTRALAAIHQWVGTLSDTHRSLVSIRTIHQDIRRILHHPLPFSHAPTLVYAMGLFDYLSDRWATQLIRQLSATLAPSGVLWVSNVNRQHEYHRAYYELLGGWELIFRNPSDLLGWCDPLGLSGCIVDPSDPHNTHSYIRMTR